MAAVGGGDEVLEVNVGGKVYTLLRATLCAEKDSVLAKMFDADSRFGKITQDPQGRPFLDRNGDTFALVVEYLRNGCTLTEGEISGLSSKDISKLQRGADYFFFNEPCHCHQDGIGKTDQGDAVPANEQND